MSIYKILILIGLIQGLLLTFALLIKNYGNKKQNHYFFALIFLICFALLSKFLFNAERFQALPHIWYVVDITTYSIGFLWFLTIQKSIYPKIKLSKNDYLLLSPILYHVFFLIFIFTISKKQLLLASQKHLYSFSFYIFCLTALFVNIAFLWKSHLILKKYKDTRFPDLLIKGQYAFLIILLIWITSFALSFFTSHSFLINLKAYSYAFLSLAFLTFTLAFLAIIKPESFYFLTQTFDASENYVLKQIADKAVLYLEEKEAFLKNNFSLNELSQAIQSNSVLTSKAINRILKTSYSDLINKYRVNHFVKLAHQEQLKNLTLWAIAQDAGFANKVTFYKAFKKNTGTTPKNYLTNFTNK